MELQQLAYLMAVLVGVVSSGLVGSAWELATGEEVRLRHLFDRDPNILTPLRAMAAVFSAPSTMLRDGFWWLIAQPMFGLPILAFALGWSFLQGVFILTQVFGFH